MAGRTRGTRGALALAALLLAAVGLALCLAAVGCSQGTPSSTVTTGRPSQEVASSPHGAVAYATAKAYASSFPQRGADTWGEIRAREFVYGTFQQFGYTPHLQEFITTAADGRVHSANILVVKEGASAERLVIGAHYDATGGEGYADNATGVGLLLELAARLATRQTPYTLVFVAFGADDREQLGSQYFVESMTKLERGATRGTINLDAVAGGDHLYVFSRTGSPSWLRDDMLAEAAELGVPLQTTPERPDSSAGTATLATSDIWFTRAGVPAASLVASNWAAGRGDGRVQTVAHGRLWDTKKDTVQFVDTSYPGRVQKQLADLTRLLEQVMTSELEKSP